MATWITHLMVADSVLHKMPWLDRRGFCVGNIAPDCNVENEDRTALTPSREITHWMGGDRKTGSDADRYLNVYVLKRIDEISSNEKYISITPDEVKAFAADAVAIVTRKIEEIGERR